MKRGFAALTLLVASAVTVPAWSASPALDEAKKLTASASIEYDVGHFEQALDLYAKAYEKYPKPALLFDIGQCHRLLGHHERAVFFFQGYLRGKPDAPNRALVEKLIADSQHQLATQAQVAETASPSSAPTAAPGRGDAPPAQGPDASAVAPGGPAATDSAGAVTRTPGKPALRIAGFATGGVGVVLLGVAIFEGLHASSLSGQVSQVSSSHGAWTSQAQSDYDSGKSAATAANVLYVTGAVALAAGAAMAWLGWPRTHATTAAIAPLPGGAAASLVTSF